jgi:hypothetical protein
VKYRINIRCINKNTVKINKKFRYRKYVEKKYKISVAARGLVQFWNIYKRENTSKKRRASPAGAPL